MGLATLRFAQEENVGFLHRTGKWAEKRKSRMSLQHVEPKSCRKNPSKGWLKRKLPSSKHLRCLGCGTGSTRGVSQTPVPRAIDYTPEMEPEPASLDHQV